MSDFLCEILGIDAPALELLEVDSALLEHLDRLVELLVLVDVEVEVELPSADGLRRLSVLVHKGNTYLYNIEEVHVQLDLHIVPLVCVSIHLLRVFYDDAGELCVHGYIGVLLEEICDNGQLIFEVVIPDVFDD